MAFADRFAEWYSEIHSESKLPQQQPTDSADFGDIVWMVYHVDDLEHYAVGSFVPLIDGVTVTTDRDIAYKQRLREALLRL